MYTGTKNFFNNIFSLKKHFLYYVCWQIRHRYFLATICAWSSGHLSFLYKLIWFIKIHPLYPWWTPYKNWFGRKVTYTGWFRKNWTNLNTEGRVSFCYTESCGWSFKCGTHFLHEMCIKWSIFGKHFCVGVLAAFLLYLLMSSVLRYW